MGNSAPVALQKIIAEVRSLTCAALPTRVTVAVEVPSEPIVVAGDAAQLHQMLANLVTNAVQAVSESGRVVIRAAAVEVDAERDCTVGHLLRARYARVDVIDSGLGMTNAQVERIFDPFLPPSPWARARALACPSCTESSSTTQRLCRSTVTRGAGRPSVRFCRSPRANPRRSRLPWRSRRQRRVDSGGR